MAEGATYDFWTASDYWSGSGFWSGPLASEFFSDYYVNLITSEHNTKPRFTNMVALVCSPLSSNQKLLAKMPGGYFDLDLATGQQLDMIGLWLGLGRRVLAPISGVYFSFDTVGLGWDQGVWKGPYDPDSGLVDLDDGTYRTMLKAKIGANQWDGTLESYQTILANIFAGTGTIAYARDYQDMSIDVVLTGTAPSALLLSLLQNGYFPLKPMTVRIRGYVVI